MKTQLLRVVLPGLTAGGLLLGCVAAPDEPSVQQALANLLDPPPPPEVPIKPQPGESAVEARPVNQDAAKERRVQSMAHFATAVSHDIRREKKKAIEEYFKAGMSNAADTGLVKRVVRYLLDNKDSHRAALILVKATELKDSPAELDAWLGIAYAREGKLDLAIIASEAAIRKSPDTIQAYRNLCTIYRDMKRPKNWLETIRNADQVKDPDADFLAGLAGLYLDYSKTHPNEAKSIKSRVQKILSAAREQNPKEPAVLLKMLAAHEVAGEFAAAAGFAESLLKLSPRNAVLRRQAAQLHMKAGRVNDSERHLKELVKLTPADPQTNWALGLMAKDRRDYPKAAEFFARVMTLNRNFEPVYYELASVQIIQDRARQALSTLELARKRFKPNFMLEFWTAAAHRSLKDYAKALAHFASAEAQAIANKEKQYLSSGFYFDVGATQERSKRFHEAEKSFRKAIELDPDFAGALNYLGYMWAERGENLKEAHQMISKAVKLDGNNAAYLDSMAWVTFQMGDAKEALKWQLKALKAMERDKEEDAVLYEHLGDIYHALKDVAGARKFWKKSLGIEDNPKVKARLDKLPAAQP